MDIRTLIAQMSLEQKCALLTGAGTFNTQAYENPQVPAFYLSDGPHGVRKQEGASDHLGIAQAAQATCFPTAVTLAQTWNTELVKEVGVALGKEACARDVDVLLGPGMNIKRDPRCGRNFEYYSEDPLVSGEMAAALVEGIQESGASACPKHFAVNSQETRRMASDSRVDERTLRELYLSAFELCIKKAHPRCIMTSYNLINGTYANEHTHLLQDILRDEWGYTGAVVTDWGGSNDHVAGVQATSSLEMPAAGWHSVQELIDAVRSGKLAESVVDDRVYEVLELGLVSREQGSTTKEQIEATGGIEALFKKHHDLARKAARAGVVLLKNDPVAPVELTSGEETSPTPHPLLPLKPGTRVALIGDFAKTPRYQGSGSSLVNPPQIESLCDVIEAYDLEYIGYEQGFIRTHAEYDEKGAATKADALRSAAVRLATQADVVLVCMGLDETRESEGADRSDMQLLSAHVDVLRELAEVNKHLVVLLSAGSSVECIDWIDHVPSVVYQALGGQASASAVMDIVCGREVPQGRLTETWVERLRDVATASYFPSKECACEYRETYRVGYRNAELWSKNHPHAFPFGYGLGYAEVRYGIAEIVSTDKAGLPTEVAVEITNESDIRAVEVCQVYVSRPQTAIARPDRVLAGFARVELGSHETKRVVVTLWKRAFEHYDVEHSQWEVEAGVLNLLVGPNCRDIAQTLMCNIPGTCAYTEQLHPTLDPQVHASAYTDDEAFVCLLGYTPASSSGVVHANTTIGELIHSKSLLVSLAAKMLHHQLEKTERAGKADLNLLFLWNMPLRALAKMSNGMVDSAMVAAVVYMAEGHGLRGLGRFVKAFFHNDRLQRSATAKLNEKR